MTKKSNALGIVVIAAVLLIAVVYGISVALKRTPEGSQPTARDNRDGGNGSMMDASTLVYDAKKTLVGTGVTVSFPKDGYGGEGVTLGDSRESTLQIFEKISNLYIRSNPDGIPQIEVSVYQLENEKTLDDAIKTIMRDQMPELSSGGYQTINGIRYFLFTDSGGTIHIAYALVKGNLLNVVMQNELNPAAGVSSRLFTDFLSHIDLTCASDCSMNAGPVIDMGKQGEE